jgi:hypothetical protein
MGFEIERQNKRLSFGFDLRKNEIKAKVPAVAAVIRSNRQYFGFDPPPALNKRFEPTPSPRGGFFFVRSDRPVPG